jgi:hypothetical protein
VWTVGDVEVHAAVVAAGRKAHEREEPVREAEAHRRCTCMLSSHDNAHNIEDARVQGEESRIESPLQRDLKGVNAATRVLKQAAPNTWTCATAALEV